MAPYPSNNTCTKDSVINTSENVPKEVTKWTGKKFDLSGQVLPFAGNTIISHLPLDSALHRALLTIHEKLNNSKFTKFHTLLPPSSWHMTVFEGVCDQRRKPDVWPKDLPLDAPLVTCHDLFKHKLSKFDLDVPVPLRLAITGLIMSRSGIRLDLAPIDDEEEKSLRGLRDRLSNLLQIRARGHEIYVFHLALAYKVALMGREDEKDLLNLFQELYVTIPHDFELGAPEFCHFDDMFAFHRQMFLK
ncbi:RNA ligase/cyclic nucleotide phosphodiesterase [Trichoderma evansii]